MSEKNILRFVVGAVIVLFIASWVISIKGWEIPPPDDWLLGWTSWLATVVTIVVAARVFWIGGNCLRKLVNEGPFWRKNPGNETAT